VALNRGLAIAQQPRDAPNQLQLLSLLHMFHHRIGDFNLNPAVEAGRLRISLCSILEISENRQLRGSSILVTSNRWYSARQIKAFVES